jgi:hypothetical protein
VAGRRPPRRTRIVTRCTVPPDADRHAVHRPAGRGSSRGAPSRRTRIGPLDADRAAERGRAPAWSGAAGRGRGAGRGSDPWTRGRGRFLTKRAPNARWSPTPAARGCQRRPIHPGARSSGDESPALTGRSAPGFVTKAHLVTICQKPTCRQLLPEAGASRKPLWRTQAALARKPLWPGRGTTGPAAAVHSGATRRCARNPTGARSATARSAVDNRAAVCRKRARISGCKTRCPGRSWPRAAGRPPWIQGRVRRPAGGVHRSWPMVDGPVPHGRAWPSTASTG